MKLLDFALRQAERGHQPWPTWMKVLAIAITVALVLGVVLYDHLVLLRGFGFGSD